MLSFYILYYFVITATTNYLLPTTSIQSEPIRGAVQSGKDTGPREDGGGGGGGGCQPIKKEPSIPLRPDVTINSTRKLINLRLLPLIIAVMESCLLRVWITSQDLNIVKKQKTPNIGRKSDIQWLY